MKSILITQSQLHNYSGSEIVTLELAEYFSVVLNWNVTILTHHASYPIKQEFDKLNVNIILSSSQQAREIEAQFDKFDILWIHHYTLTPELVKNFSKPNRKTKIIFNHMSFVEPFETMQYPAIELKIADLILFNSFETKDKLLEHIGETDQAKFVVFDNPAPDYFLKKTRSSSGITNIAIVSNHPPEELVAAAEILQKINSVAVTFIGRVKDGKISRVTPEFIDKYDAIVTIGKTVQYSILLGKPVYCYDRFGGPGYLSLDNFELAHYHNFSGRGFSCMSPEKIANDIVMQHKSASSVAEALKSKYGKQFTISRKLKEVFTILETTKSSSAKIHELNPLLKHVELFTKLVPGYALYIHFARHLTEYELEHGKRLLRERKLLKIENKDLSRDRDSLRKEVEKYKKYVKYEKHYRDAVNSKSYRIGRIVTAPIRLIKNLVK